MPILEGDVTTLTLDMTVEAPDGETLQLFIRSFLDTDDTYPFELVSHGYGG
jgi:hypothetical protein